MFTEDFTPYFADFGVDATLNGVAVRGLLDAPYAVGSVGSVGMAGTEPAFTLPTASVPAGVVGMALVAGGKTYTVAAHEPDGTGVSRLVLEDAA